MKKPKLILLDIDGTLTNSKKEITPRTKEALIRAQNEGVRLAIASGRVTGGLMQFATQLEMDKHHGLLVSYNGAKVSDCQSGEVYFEQPLTVEQAKAILEHMKKFDVIPMIDLGTNYMYLNDAFAGNIHDGKGNPIDIIRYETRSNKLDICEVKDLAAFVTQPIFKILNAGEPDYLKEHYQEMAAPFEGEVNSMFTAPFYYEFTAKNVDKMFAIKTSFEPMGYLPEDMMAFGDAQNDLTMVKYAGVGVAMGNAVEELKQVADIVTLSNDEDGIAEVVNRIFEQ